MWLIVNKNVPESRQVADHYIAKRGVPKGNVVDLDLPKDGRHLARDYDAKLAGPLRDALKGQKDKVKVLLTTYGVPLRVGQLAPNAEREEGTRRAPPELADARKKLAELEKKKDADKKELDAARAEVNKLNDREQQAVARREPGLRRQRTHAALVAEVRTRAVGAEPALLPGVGGVSQAQPADPDDQPPRRAHRGHRQAACG